MMQLEYIHDDPLHRRAWCEECGCEVEVKKWCHPLDTMTSAEVEDFICPYCGRVCEVKENGDDN